ncbi:unnamed protein product, partial [Mycena citricolor]
MSIICVCIGLRAAESLPAKLDISVAESSHSRLKRADTGHTAPESYGLTDRNE